jgi:ATP-dependent RNA helicase A
MLKLLSEYYFLEDEVQLVNFVPLIGAKKRKNNNNNNNNDDDDDDVCIDEIDDSDDINCNTIVSTNYSEKTRNSMKQISEKSLPFEVIEELIKYIRTLDQPGAILIFLPGWNLIYAFLNHPREHPIFGSKQYLLLPLHSQIPREEQHRVFEDVPQGVTKIIVSTNIAESSLTINDVVYVIDSCKVKQKIFTSRNNMTNYETVWASKANLEQRKGRAGRVRSGYCVFLISRALNERLENHSTPEIFRTPLHELALSIKLLRLGQIKEFLAKAIEPPPLDAVYEAELALIEMHALDSNRELTPLGKILARLPIEPKLGKLIIMGCVFSVGDAMCVIAAGTTFPEPFLHDGKHLRMMHKNFAGRRQSDHVALLFAFQQWLRAKWRGEEAEKEFCERKCLNMSTMRMTFEAKNQLKDIMSLSGFPEESLSEISIDINSPDGKLDIINSLLCQALYPNVCFHTEKRKLITCDGKSALIHTNSVNCGREIQNFPSPFFIFGEKIKTRAVSAKQMTMVTPLQLLLFASDKVETVPNEIKLICLDNWITLSIERDVASLVTSLRVALDYVLVLCTKDPQEILTNPSKIEQLGKTIGCLSDQDSNHIVYTRLDNNIPIVASTSINNNNNNSESPYEPSSKRKAVDRFSINTRLAVVESSEIADNDEDIKINIPAPSSLFETSFISFTNNNQEEMPQEEQRDRFSFNNSNHGGFNIGGGGGGNCGRYFQQNNNNNNSFNHPRGFNHNNFRGNNYNNFRGGNNNNNYRGGFRPLFRGKFNGRR